MLAWIHLLIAGLFEIGWPLGLKYFEKQGQTVFLLLAVVSMGISGYFLILAQRSIPIGTAYAVWTGIGAVGTFMLGVYLFGDLLSTLRCCGILLILAGIVLLKVA